VITYLIEETLRQAANFPTVLVRDDWLLGVIAVQQVQMFLTVVTVTVSAGCASPPSSPPTCPRTRCQQARHSSS
jgi:hypothetical protein